MLSRIQQHLARRTKRLSRRRLYPFISHHLSEVVDAVKQPYILNVGSGGSIDHLVHEVADRRQATVISIDIDADRKPDVVADVCDLPYPDNSFDCVVCGEVLEHVWQPHQAIREMHRILKPAGTLILTTRFLYPLHDRPHDYFRYTRYALQRLCEPFSSFSITEQLNWGETVALIPARLIREPGRRFQVVAIFLFLTAALLDVLGGALAKVLPSDFATSGYMLIAKK